MNKTSFKLLDLNQWNSKHSSPAILKKNFVYSPESPSSGCGPQCNTFEKKKKMKTDANGQKMKNDSKV